MRDVANVLQSTRKENLFGEHSPAARHLSGKPVGAWSRSLDSAEEAYLDHVAAELGTLRAAVEAGRAGKGPTTIPSLEPGVFYPLIITIII